MTTIIKKIFSLLVILTLLRNPCFAYPMPHPFPPFRIAGNLYYVGTDDLASYLIVTSQGNILINSDLEANVPMIKASIEKLGFKFSDTKILLISHAHFDHATGSKLIQQQTKAKYEVMDADVSLVQSGGKTDFQYANDASTYFPATTVDSAYPTIAQDYEHAFTVMKSLPCDIFLGAHAIYFDLEKKYKLLNKSKKNPFIDPIGYKKHIAEKEQEFYTALKADLP